MLNQRTPDLNFKYVNGFGDFVAAILHCKLFGWLTYLLTKKNVPCSTCSNRRDALNVLIPFPLWKWFFKNKTELLEHLAAEYRSLGYKVEIDTKYNKLSIFKAETENLTPPWK